MRRATDPAPTTRKDPTTMASKPHRRRLLGATGALALGVAVALAGAAPAFADPNIDPDAEGSITVHKLEQPDSPSGLPNDGTEVDTTGLTPLAGVEFTVQQVTSIDLTTNDGWAMTEGLTAADVLADAATYPLGTAATQVTDAAGEALFGSLPVGVYLVQETDPGTNDIVDPAAPFLVSIPLPLDNDWLYDVHVYPKNALGEIVKDVDEGDAYGLGDEVVWTITTGIPTLTDGATLDSYVVTDQLDPRLGFVSATATIDGTTPLTTTGTESGGLVTLDFASELATLSAAAGQTVVITLTTTVDELGDGIIENDATLFVNDSDVESNTVETQWGAVVLLKHAEGDESAVLEGAEFQIFATEADALDYENATPIAIDGVSTFTSDADGLVAFPGLKAGTYWVVEITAPTGYTTDHAPIEVEVVAGDVTLDSVDYAVPNPQTPPFELPLTGGGGTMLFLLGGLALLATAFGVGMTRLRKTAA